MNPQGIDPTKLIDKLFKIKKLQYNTYDIQHPEIKGQLRVITMPVNFLQTPSGVGQQNKPTFGMSSQTIVGFTNTGKKRTPTNKLLTPDMVPTEKKEDLTRFYENANEPWNEFILQGNPSMVARVKTVLTRVEWLTEHVNAQGDPVLWAYTNPALDVFDETTGDAGLP